MTHSVLLIGQSNMAGRGNPNDAPLVKNKRIFVLRNGRWQGIYRPVNPDRPFSGVCLAESFAYEYSEAHPDVNVGIIPCADGGTTLDQWAEGGVLFDNAVNNARLAQRSSQIVAVLWHQGEGDCPDNLYPLYEEKFLKIMAAFRRQLGLENVPFLLGGLGDFLPLRTAEPQYKNYSAVNKTLQKIADEAAGQCGRGILPKVRGLLTFEQTLAEMQQFDSCFTLYEGECPSFRASLPQKGSSTALLIGSEGGFSADEIEKAKAAGVLPVSLGKRILRCETAPLCVLSDISYEFEL